MGVPTPHWFFHKQMKSTPLFVVASGLVATIVVVGSLHSGGRVGSGEVVSAAPLHSESSASSLTTPTVSQSAVVSRPANAGADRAQEETDQAARNDASGAQVQVASAQTYRQEGARVPQSTTVLSSASFPVRGSTSNSPGGSNSSTGAGPSVLVTSSDGASVSAPPATLDAALMHSGDAEDLGVVLPAALTPEGSSIRIDTDQQVVEWEKLQDDFIKEVGSAIPETADERAVWIAAQRRSDDAFRAKFGTAAFLRQNIESYRRGLTQN